MHELSVMQTTLEMAVEQARRSEAKTIHVIRMRVGALSGVVPEALEFAFSAVTKDSIAAQARLEIERVLPLCYCASCQLEFEPGSFLYECPQCHSFSAEVRRGRELELSALEVS